MKNIKNILGLNVIILFIALIGLSTSYFLAHNLAKLEGDRDYESISNQINKSKDIEWLKNLSQVMLQERESSYSGMIAWHKRIAIYQAIIILACLISLFLLQTAPVIIITNCLTVTGPQILSSESINCGTINLLSICSKNVIFYLNQK